MKIAPIVRTLQAHGGLAFKIIHAGQHYDREMNDVFFEEVGIPEHDVFMAVGGGSHAQQTAKIMVAFEGLCQGAIRHQLARATSPRSPRKGRGSVSPLCNRYVHCRNSPCPAPPCACRARTIGAIYMNLGRAPATR